MKVFLTHLVKRHRTVLRGALVGGVIGVLAMGSYVAAGSIFCVGLRTCPGSWVPYALIFVIGVVAFVIVFAGVTAIIRAIYNRHYRNQI